jgi:hypothetical protein
MPDLRTQSFKESIIDVMGGMDAIHAQLDPIKQAAGRFAATKVGGKFSRGFLSTFGYEMGGETSGWFWKSIPKTFSTAIEKNGLALGIAKGIGHAAGRLFMPAFTAMEMYEGYEKNGVTGALVAGAKSAVQMGIFEVGMAPALYAAPFVIAGMVGYGIGEAAIAHQKKLRRLEMGTPQIDRFGTIATTRQRSLQALQRTHINGRLALGNEALLMHY